MVDWSPFGGNPVPGDPGQIKVLAGSFHDLATDVETQNSLLKALKADSTGVWEGPAADAFRPHLEDLPPKLDKFVRSYREAGDALSTYAPKLQHAQDDAVAALTKATEAMRRLGTAQANKATQDAANKKAAAAATPDHPAPTVAQPDYGAAVQQAQADLDAAHRAKDHAVDEARTAAHQCIDAVKQAASDGIKNKHHHWWDTVVDVLTHPLKLLKVISVVANTLSGIFAILALVTCWIPGVGEFFEAASLITGVIGLAADCALAIFGKGSWSDVLVDAVGVGTAGVGHVFGEAAKAGQVAEEGSRAVAEGESTLAHSADLKAEARTMLQTGKGGRTASKATKAEAEGLRKEAGRLTKEGKALTKSGQEAVDSAASPLKYGANKTAAELPKRLVETTRDPARLGRDAVEQARQDLGRDGVGKTVYEYFGNGDPASAAYRTASIATNIFSAGLTTNGAAGADHKAATGHLFDQPPSAAEQVREFENSVDPLVLTGVTGPHGGNER